MKVILICSVILITLFLDPKTSVEKYELNILKTDIQFAEYSNSNSIMPTKVNQFIGGNIIGSKNGITCYYDKDLKCKKIIDNINTSHLINDCFSYPSNNKYEIICNDKIFKQNIDNIAFLNNGFLIQKESHHFYIKDGSQKIIDIEEDFFHSALDRPYYYIFEDNELLHPTNVSIQGNIYYDDYGQNFGFIDTENNKITEPVYVTITNIVDNIAIA